MVPTLIFIVLSALFFLLFCFFLFLYLKTTSDYHKEAQLRNDFMAMMIHDLRSPLSVIKGSANLVRTQFIRLSQQQINDMLSQIETSSTNLLTIVNDLLDMAKLEAGKIELTKHNVDIMKMLSVELEIYKPAAKQKNVELRFVSVPDSLTFSFDDEKIKHVVMNLVSNALKFTKEGYVEIVAERKGGIVKISVTDTGPGVPDVLRKNLFKKFVQVSAPSSKEKGTGLGLVITKGIVETHGGRIWIEDNIPHGARFVFTLPLK